MPKFKLRGTICLIGLFLLLSSFESSVSSQLTEFGHVNELEFMSMYQSETRWTEEIELIKRAFPHEESVIDRNTYFELLSSCILASYNLGDSVNSDLEEFVNLLKIHVKEFVIKTRAQDGLRVRDAYEDLFQGKLKHWLLMYDSNPVGSSSSTSQDSQRGSELDHEDL